MNGGMSFSGGSRATPYSAMPITIGLYATKQKVFREIHCIECGMPFLNITDKVITLMDFDTPIEDYRPDVVGRVQMRCTRKNCAQRYVVQF